MKSMGAERRTCTRKIRFKSQTIAEVVRCKHAMPDVLHSYPCPCCRGWHIGGFEIAAYGRRGRSH